MSGILDSEPIARKTLVIFYLIDTSGSMYGTKIGTVNTVMEETISEIRDIGGSDSEVKVAVLTFGTDAEWVYESPVSVEELTWKRIEADGWTNLGDALRELDSKLSRSGYMKDAHLSFAPIIFLISDGYPQPGFEEPLERIQNNKWFKHALKVAFAVGSDADKELLAEFTGDKETVVQVMNGEALARLIKFITIKSSMIGSKSTMNAEGKEISDEEADEMKKKQLVTEIQNAVDPNDLKLASGW